MRMPLSSQDRRTGLKNWAVAGVAAYSSYVKCRTEGRHGGDASTQTRQRQAASVPTRHTLLLVVGVVARLL